jgi:hypothetical protein
LEGVVGAAEAGEEELQVHRYNYYRLALVSICRKGL